MTSSDKAPALHRAVVETAGDFMLQDVSANQVVEAHRPSLVRITPFITQRLDNRQLSIVENDVDEKYTDEQVQKDWQAGKFKSAKKQPVEVTKVAKAVNEDKTPGKVEIKPGSPKHPTESEGQFKARLEAESKKD